jgi:hypothetical protein
VSAHRVRKSLTIVSTVLACDTIMSHRLISKVAGLFLTSLYIPRTVSQFILSIGVRSLNEQDYDKRRREKTLLYRENNLSLIQIVPEDLRVIKFVLEKELEKWDVPFRKPKNGFIDFVVQLLQRVFNIFRRPR